MTGTAMTEATEFWKIYKLDVIAIPTNRPMRRINHPDVIYLSEREKYEAIADEIERIHKWDVVGAERRQLSCGDDRTRRATTRITIERQGQPATRKRAASEDQESSSARGGRSWSARCRSRRASGSAALLERRGIKHQVLNAKHHKREAEIVAQAGRKSAVTIATNMAGRGTDIILGGNPETMAWAILQDKYPTRLDVPQEEWDALVKEIEAARADEGRRATKVKELGGLHIIGTERHEARRIDLQLRGRCGRQGDPGSSRFYLSLEDDLMRIFAGEWVKNVLTRLGMQEGEAIESRMVSRRIEGAQKKVEERNFEIRKNLLEYDEVMDEQRKRVYGYRQRILDGANCKQLILEMIDEQIEQYLSTILDKDYGSETFAKWAGSTLAVELEGRRVRGSRFRRGRAARQGRGQPAGRTADLRRDRREPARGRRQADWNWEALAKFANVRWKLNLRDRDLKKVGRDNLAELLVEKAREAIEKTDLSEGARFLERDFGVQDACGWVQYKFGIETRSRRGRELDARGDQGASARRRPPRPTTSARPSIR